jgi:hypothetical protein
MKRDLGPIRARESGEEGDGAIACGDHAVLHDVLRTLLEHLLTERLRDDFPAVREYVECEEVARDIEYDVIRSGRRDVRIAGCPYKHTHTQYTSATRFLSFSLFSFSPLSHSRSDRSALPTRNACGAEDAWVLVCAEGCVACHVSAELSSAYALMQRRNRADQRGRDVDLVQLPFEFVEHKEGIRVDWQRASVLQVHGFTGITRSVFSNIHISQQKQEERRNMQRRINR